MKVVILAGGLGTRLSEETQLVPKPMVEIGGKPILWHIMKIYSHFGFNDFVILTGYKSHVIKDFFVNYYQRYSDLTVDLATNAENTMTGGRIKRAQDYIGNERFMLTYGDGVADVDLKALLAEHESSGKLCTMTVVQPAGRFGAVVMNDGHLITSFMEKPAGTENWVNGGFFVCEPKVFEYINGGDKTTFEREPLETLAADGQLNAYRHHGFWQPMDMLRDKIALTKLWQSDQAPWAVWQKR